MRTLLLFLIDVVCLPATILKRLSIGLSRAFSYVRNSRRLYTLSDVQHTKINAPSVNALWNFLFSHGMFNKWNTVIRDLDFEKLHDEERLRFIHFVDEESEESSDYILGSIRYVADDHSKRISFIYTKNDVISNLTYLFEQHGHEIYATRTMTLRTVGSRNKIKMLKQRKQLNKKSENEMRDVSKLTNKLFIASRVYRSVVQSPMSKYVSVS